MLFRSVGEVRRIVQGKICRFEGREVGDEDPIPRRDKDILRLYVSVRNLLFPSVPQAGEYLERYPFLLNGGEEGTRTEGRINE